jgi:2-oxoisovalerate dehydrogenase E1 component
MKWDKVAEQLVSVFGYSQTEVDMYAGEVENDKATLAKIYKALQLARGFENACNQQYMQGKIRGFMHLDNG